jgi:hypothetical protein
VKTILTTICHTAAMTVVLFAAGPMSDIPCIPADDTGRDCLDSEILARWETLGDDLKNIARFQEFRNETLHPAALVGISDRDPLDILLRRTRVLLGDIRQMTGAPDMSGFEKRLTELETAAAGVDVGQTDERFRLFTDASRLRRRIAFSNPLLDFDRLLFIKRHRSTFDHMCDQYYGVNAVPGGGLFVLADPFGPEPRAIDLLNGVPLQNGRLAGRSLDGGSFLSPELTFDGGRIFFAWTECEGDQGHVSHLDHQNRGHWDRGRCHHLFSVAVGADGAAGDLRQLTDGTFNDFDPCVLPNGRVAFISERRGGYLRCGRECPSYTIHDMKPDGSDIRLLSPRENNEWQPSLNHDGMIIYTRWDYVDRHGCVAHHPWVMTPDGRDSRAIHGNFSVKAKRADMEMDLRAIPGSHKIIGTAAPHHGQAYGSIIMVDPMIPDDDAMAPVKRVTPDVGFPESQNGRQVYGTPWPLGENYFLCVYDAGMRKGGGRQGDKHVRGDYGIYLVDAFGNKELLYRDPGIGCLSPMPLRSRPMPPVIPEKSWRLAADPPQDGTMAVMDVYNSHLPFPDGSRIKALRIYQIHPSAVPSGQPPHETGKRIAEAGDSINLARGILGTVPVEEDGSAFFTVPALKEVYFQALDEDGLAVQSMRSSTWVQPGEMLVCHGCHEPGSRAPAAGQTAMALRRPPSAPRPDVDGTRPFSYPRLVQPVLDRHCVECHADKADKGAPPLDATIVDARLGVGTTPVYRSYDSLIHDFAFWRYGDPYRTTPGKFGARASKLYQILREGHHDVALDKEETHRLTVWLDSLSNFYGVYEKEGGEAQLRGEIAWPGLE